MTKASTALSDWSDQTDLTDLLQLNQPFTFTNSANPGIVQQSFLRLRMTAK
jgi:hypothetical protein